MIFARLKFYKALYTYIFQVLSYAFVFRQIFLDCRQDDDVIL